LRAWPSVIRCYDVEQKKSLVSLTNNFTLPAATIAALYKCRWQIELFFKWINGNLHIKRFLGNSINAVKTQIWIAVSVYILVAIAKKQLNVNLRYFERLERRIGFQYNRVHAAVNDNRKFSQMYISL
jgi:IS4 transposase